MGAAYTKLFENVYEDLILVTFALFGRLLIFIFFGRLGIFIHVAHWSSYGRRWCSTLSKDIPLRFDGLLDFLLRWWLNDLGVRDCVLTYVLGRHQLWVSIVDYFVYDLID